MIAILGVDPSAYVLVKVMMSDQDVMVVLKLKIESALVNGGMSGIAKRKREQKLSQARIKKSA
jgi:hypothetical protein